MDLWKRITKRVLKPNLLASSPSSLIQDENIQKLAKLEIKKFSEIPDPMTLNNTSKAQVDFIVFNRVPKVGSQMLTELMTNLAKRNGFNVFIEGPQKYEIVILTNALQADLSGLISNLPQPGTLTQHFAYIDFKKFNHPKPIYINLVRNPVDRVISWFYYVRAPWRVIYRIKTFPELPLPDTDWLTKDFSTCVLEKDSDCSFVPGSLKEEGDHRRQMLFFCGSDTNCIPFDSPIAYEKAKRTVKEEYAVVGLLEDMNITLAVLERYIPKFFAGATELYYKDYEKYTKTNRNNYKAEVSDEIKELVRLNMTNEYKFYEFCKKRLHLQFIATETKKN